MQGTSCQNCGYTIEPGAVFCSRCGQKTNLHRFTMPHLSHEIMHAVTHTDKGIFFLMRELTLRPGEVLYNYLSRHQRKKYFSPFTFLLLMAGLLLLSNSTFKPYQSANMIPKEQKAAAEQLIGKEKAAIIYERTQKSVSYTHLTLPTNREV